MRNLLWVFLLLTGCGGNANVDNVNDDLASRFLDFDLTPKSFDVPLGGSQVVMTFIENRGGGTQVLDLRWTAAADGSAFPVVVDPAVRPSDNRVVISKTDATSTSQLTALQPAGEGVRIFVAGNSRLGLQWTVFGETEVLATNLVAGFRVPEGGLVAEVPVTVSVSSGASRQLQFLPGTARFVGREPGTVSVRLNANQVASEDLPERLSMSLERVGVSTGLGLAVSNCEVCPEPNHLTADIGLLDGLILPRQQGPNVLEFVLNRNVPINLNLELLEGFSEVIGSAELVIRDPSNQELQRIDLRFDVRSQAEQLEISPETLAFGEVSEPTARSLFITNPTDGPLEMRFSVQTSPGGLALNAPPYFEFEPTMLRLPAGETREVELRFDPTPVQDRFPSGPFTGSVSIDSSLGEETLAVVALTGRVTINDRLPRRVGVAVSTTHACELLPGSGQLRCWGTNNFGQLDTGDTVDLKTRGAGQRSDVSDVSVGDGTTCYSNDGSIQCLGRNDVGQAGQTVDSNSQFLLTPQNVALPERAIALATGAFHSCAVLETSGEVHCWGAQIDGGLGRGGISQSSSPLPVLRADGRVLNNAVSVDAARDVTCAVIESVTDRVVECWGGGAYAPGGAFPPPASAFQPRLLDGGPTDVEQIAIEQQHGCLRRSNGEVYCFGRNLTGVVSSDPSISAAGPTLVPLSFAASQISVGRNFACAMRVGGGELACWGSNSASEAGGGQLGAGLEPEAFYPPSTVVEQLTGRAVGEGDPISSLSSGDLRSCASSQGGRIWCWGRGTNLGDLQSPGPNGRTFDRFAAILVQPAGGPFEVEQGYCGNGLDEDGDGAFDFDDSDCATDIGSALQFQSTVRGQGNDGPDPCGFSNRFQDQVLSWVSPSSGTFELRVGPGPYELAVSTTNDFSSDVECRLPGSNEPLLMEPAASGTQYFIFLGAQSTLVGPYSLEICEGRCI